MQTSRGVSLRRPGPGWSPGRAAAVRRLARGFFAAVARVRVEGMENVPRSGASVLVFNHLTNFDAHLIFARLPRTDVAALAASKYRSRPLHRLAVEAAGGIWLRRGAAVRVALRRALALLRDGWIVGIAPEGGRSPTGGLAPGREGAAFLAVRADVPVLPVALTGTERIAGSIPFLRRPPVTLRFGAPFRPDPGIGRSGGDRLVLATDEIMERLALLLPSPYRGVYGGTEPAGRPR